MVMANYTVWFCIINQCYYTGRFKHWQILLTTTRGIIWWSS